MAPDRRSRRGRYGLRWGRGYYGVRVEHNIDDTIAGEPVRRVLDQYCPFCATDIRSVGPRRLVRCPNVAICGKILPIDDSTCPNCCHYTRHGDNFCRVCRTNLRGVVRGHGGLYQQLNRAPSPVLNPSPPREEPQAADEDESEDEEVGGGGRGGGAPIPVLGRGRNPVVPIPLVPRRVIVNGNEPPLLFSREELRQFGLLRDLEV